MTRRMTHDHRQISDEIGLALGLCLIYAMNALTCGNSGKKHAFGLSAGRSESPGGTPHTCKTLPAKSLLGGKKGVRRDG